MVRSRIEDPEIQSQRRQIAQSKSVSELSQIQNLGEFPIPTTIEKLMAAKKQSESSDFCVSSTAYLQVWLTVWTIQRL